MKVAHRLPPVDDREVELYDMPTGLVGLTFSGLYYFRSSNAAVCLNEVGQSYSNLYSRNGVKVTLLPAGTEIKMICD